MVGVVVVAVVTMARHRARGVAVRSAAPHDRWSLWVLIVLDLIDRHVRLLHPSVIDLFFGTGWFTLR